MSGPVLAISTVRAPGTVLAYVRRTDHGFEWAATSQLTTPELRGLVIHAATVQPVRIVRQHRGGRVVVREHRIPVGDPAWWPAFADAVTFSRAAVGTFMSKVVPEAPPNVAFAPTATLAAFEDAFAHDASRARPLPATACDCGALRPFLARACLSCGTQDALAAVAGSDPARLQTALAKLIERRLEADVLLASAERLAQAYAAHREALAAPVPDTNDLSEKERALKTLEDFQRRLTVKRLSEASAGVTVDGLKDAADKLAQRATAEATRLRSLWFPAADIGWIPTASARARLARELAALHRDALRSVGAAADAHAVAIARYAPVHRIFRKIADATWWGKAARFALTAISAVKTMGISLIVKGAIWAVKSERDAMAVKRFDESLVAFDSALQSALAALATIPRRERQAVESRRAALAAYCLRLLASDYGRASASGQQQIATRLGRRLGLRSPFRVLARAASARRFVIALALLAALVAASILYFAR